MCDCDYFMTQEILEGFTQEISARQGKVTETFHQTGQLFVRSVLPQAEEIRARDKVQSGVALRATDTAAWVYPYVFRLVCKNGLIASDRALRKTHVGRILESAEESVLAFKDDTLRADDAAFFLKVRDVVEAAVSEATFRLITEKMQKTMGIRLTGDPVKSVEVLADRYLLNDNERAGVLRHLITQGDLSGYGLVNAVTHYSEEIEDYDRATEFESIGGKLIELPSKEWQELAEAA